MISTIILPPHLDSLARPQLQAAWRLRKEPSIRYPRRPDVVETALIVALVLLLGSAASLGMHTAFESIASLSASR